MTQREPDDRLEEEEVRAEATSEEDTDVVLDIPILNVEELDLEVEELRAHISARAELVGFLNINVGVDAYVDKVKLNIKGVEAQVKLKVKLERILGSIDRALQAIDNNPQLLDPNFRRSNEAAGGEDTGGQEGPREIAAGDAPKTSSKSRSRARGQTARPQRRPRPPGERRENSGSTSRL